jgi:hypothetical protein
LIECDVACARAFEDLSDVGAAAQSYLEEYTCPAGSVYDPTSGCTLAGDTYQPYDYGDYGYLPYGAYRSYYGGHREFVHSFGQWVAASVVVEAAGTARTVPRLSLASEN